MLQGAKLEAQWAQSAAALLLELPRGQRGYQAAMFDRSAHAQPASQVPPRLSRNPVVTRTAAPAGLTYVESVGFVLSAM